MLGGYVYPRTGVALGPLTIRMMEDIHVQQTIMSVGGITAKGLFNSNLLLVETERAMMRSADEVVVRRRSYEDWPTGAGVPVRVDRDRHADRRSRLQPEQRTLIEQAEVRLIVAGERTSEEFRS